ncbi:MAG: tetratricopeptide repeat protein [Desulfovibrionaceae bacterium]
MSENKTPETTPAGHKIELNDIQGEVNAEASKAFDFLVRNAKIIIGVVVVAVGAAAVYAGVQGWSSYSEKKAMEHYTQVLSTTGEARIEALRAYVADAPESVRGGALLELAGSLMNEQRYAEAAEEWKKLEGEGRPEMRTLASLGEARCLLLSGAAEEAYAKAKAIIPLAPEAMVVPAQRLVAACAEAAGDKPGAAEALQAVLDSGTAVDAPLLSYRIEALKADQ